MRALILAAGLGTRLKPFTEHHPKALLPLAGKTLIEYQVEKLHQSGISDIIVNIHHHADELEAYIHERWPEIGISDERAALLETGGAIRKVGIEHPSDEPLLVLNVDILSNIDLRQVIEAHTSDRYATLVVSERQTQRYLCFDEGKMVGWTNIATGERKPTTLLLDEQTRLLAFSGLHILSPEAIADMQTWPERFSITDYYISRCTEKTIYAYVPEDYRMMDVGKADQLEQAEQFAKTIA